MLEECSLQQSWWTVMSPGILLSDLFLLTPNCLPPTNCIFSLGSDECLEHSRFVPRVILFCSVSGCVRILLED